MVTVTLKPRARPLGARFLVHCGTFYAVADSLAKAYGDWHYMRYGYAPVH